MITETKKPSLIPKPGETLESARSNYYGAKFPPETVGDLPGYKPSADASRESRVQAEKVKSTRSKERNRLFKKAAPYLGVVVATATLTGIGAYNKLTQPKPRVVDMLVQPYDNPSTVAQRAEDSFGKDPGGYDIQEEALRLSDKYGVLQAGDHLKVTVQ